MNLNRNLKTKLIKYAGEMALFTRVSDFPIGVEYSFKKMESILQKSKKRKFFGMINHMGNEIIYQACATFIRGDEDLDNGLEKIKIPGGQYILYTLENYRKNAHLVKEIFEEIGNKYLIDPYRPQLEYYKNNKELEIMLPIRNREEQLCLMFD